MSKLQQLLQTQHHTDYGISGGMGTSIEDAIILPLRGFNNYVSVEYTCVRCLLQSESAEGQFVEQGLMEVDDRHYDCLTFSVIGKDGQDLGRREFYFDITDCLRSAENEKNLADPEMRAIQEEIIAVLMDWRTKDPQIGQCVEFALPG